MYDLNKISDYLNTNIIGKSIIQYESLDSTLSKAKNVFKTCPDGTVILSEDQWECLLRFGNEWICLPDKNIYLSIILKSVYTNHLLALADTVSCSSICKGIRDLYNLDCKIKWPNDIFIDGKKMASVSSHIAGREAGTILSLNINVNMEEKIKDLKFTSIKINRGEDVERELLISTILNNIEYHYKEFLRDGKASQAVNFYNDNLLLSNKEIKVRKRGRKTVRNLLVKGINSEGFLLVTNKNGSEEILRPEDTIIQDEET